MKMTHADSKKTANGLEEISNFIFTSKYARFSDKKKRRETWDEAVSRVEGMHLEKYEFLSDEDKEEIKRAFNLVREKKIVPISIQTRKERIVMNMKQKWKVEQVTLPCSRANQIGIQEPCLCPRYCRA